MNSRQQRQFCHDIGLGARQNRKPLLDGLALVVDRRELAEHVRVPRLGFGQLLIEASEIGVEKVLGE